MVLLEAQASGVPVVASRVGGIAEVVRDGETGLLVAPKDVTATSERLLTLLADPHKRADYGAAARAFVERDYNQRTLNRRLLEMYASLARGDGFGAKPR